MSASRSSPTIHVSSGSASSAASAASKYAGLGLPSTVASTPAAYSRPATNTPESSRGPREVCHQLVLVQAIEVGAQLELGERPREVHVAEDTACLLGLVGPSEQHGLGALPDELDAVEVLDQRRDHSASTRLPASALAAADGGRLQLGVVELEPGAAQLLGERRPGPRRVVRHEPQPVPLRGVARRPLRSRPGSAPPTRGGPRRCRPGWRPWPPSLFASPAP